MTLKNIDTLFEDPDYLIINKPSGLLVIPDRYVREKENLREILKKKQGEIFVVHRLDRDASGVICFAKNAEAHRELNNRFENRTVKKIYNVLVKGVPDPASGTIDLPLSLSTTEPGTVWVDTQKGKKSVTDYRVIKSFNATLTLSLVEALPLTGRQHQIRVHFQNIGHPLVVDKLYSSDRGIYLSDFKRGYKINYSKEERPLIGRLSLHARQLAFHHFRTNDQLKVDASLPKDFEVTIKLLEKYSKAS